MKNFIFLFVFLISTSAGAQWVADTAINLLAADSETIDMKSIGTSDGQTYIVFWKVVAAPVNLELRVQLLDASGNKLYGDDGMLLSNSIPMGSFTVIWSLAVDADDNLYVGVTGTADSSGHAFKLDLAGNFLWGDGDVTMSDAFLVTILPLENGEAIVSWKPTGQALMQKYDAEGNAVWASAQPVESGTNDTAPGNLFELSNGDYVMVFHVLGFGINSTLYAQKYDGDGNALWTDPTQLSNKGTVFNTLYSGTQDGDIVYFGYKGVTGLRFDSFVQRLNPDGTLPWGINGMDFDVNETLYEQDTRIAFSPGSQYVWAICTYTSTGQGEHGEYVQKFDKDTGARQFTETAKLVYAVSSDFKEHTSVLHLLDDQPFFLLKNGNDNGASPTTLTIILLDANGDFAWAEETRPIATYSANKKRVHLTEPVNGQSVAVFIENKSTGEKIYAQSAMENLTGLEEMVLDYGLLVYPNPSKGIAFIEFNSTVSSETQLVIYNGMGSIVAFSNELIVKGDNLIEVDLQKFPSGDYYYQTMGGELSLSGKFSTIK